MKNFSLTDGKNYTKEIKLSQQLNSVSSKITVCAVMKTINCQL